MAASRSSSTLGLSASPERAIRRAKSLKARVSAHYMGLDGATEILAGRGTTSAPVSPFKLMTRTPIMMGIRERIWDLRRRAQSDPARLESGQDMERKLSFM